MPVPPKILNTSLPRDDSDKLSETDLVIVPRQRPYVERAAKK